MNPRPFLEGIRVLDLTTVWSGPLAGRLLAELGAEVILVESPIKKDVGTSRAASVSSDVAAGAPSDDYPRDVYNIVCHWNKKSVVINLQQPEGQELFRRLAAKSDVVLENYGGPRVMQKFGLSYERLLEVNPGIIYLGMPALGMAGPHANHTGYGLGIEQLCGYPALTGYEGEESVEKSGINYTDPVAGIHAAGAIILALIHRRRTGRGQLIDFSQRESGLNFVGEVILDWSMNRRAPRRYGNHHPWMAPHNVYRCSGSEDPWVFIACRDDREWGALSEAMGRPQLADDPRFRTLLARKQNEAELDRIVGEWTADREPKAVELLLQKAGVAAGAVQDVSQMPRDPYCLERGLFTWIRHPNGKDYPVPAAAWLFADHPRPEIHVAPMPGEHQGEVLGGLLGLSGEEIRRLEQAGAVGPGSTVV